MYVGSQVFGKGDSVGYVFIVLGLLLGALVYLVTAGAFFARGDDGLGLIQLLVPPAELVLPWLVSTRLGVLSVVSLVLTVVGAAIQSKKDDKW